MAKLLIAAVVAAAAVWFFRVWEYSPLPDLDPEEWWGPGDSRVEDTSVREFKVEFSKEMIEDLKHRLNNFRHPPPSFDGVASQYGFNSGQLDRWREIWGEKYNFTEREQFLNKYKNYKTKIQGLDIHFIWVKPEAPAGVTIVPILMLHGWPGTVRDFYEMIPDLTTPRPGRELLFEVIAPNLPGFAYSDAPARSGHGCPQIAVIMRNLMHRLGHKQFYIHAGDWGGEVASDLATLYPDDVLGLHSNLAVAKHPLALLMLAVGAVFPKWFVDPPLEDRMNRFSTMFKELGYFYMQTTKPDTIGAVLSDSPLGFLAYTFEKISIGTNYDNAKEIDGALEKAFTKEKLLDNLTQYWAARSITSTLRIYKECILGIYNRLRFNIRPTPVLTWIIQPEHEIIYQTPSALKYKFPNLVNVTVLHEAGHFLALEAPQILVKDVISSVEAFRKIHLNKLNSINQ